MELSALTDAFAAAVTLAKEIGKGGGGSTEEPTVCMSLLPLAVGVGVVAWHRLRPRGHQSSRPADSAV